MEQHAEVLRDGVRGPWRANYLDLVALAVVVAIVVLFGYGVQQMLGSLSTARAPEISLTPTALPTYALRTTIRMLAALAVSLLFTLI